MLIRTYPAIDTLVRLLRRSSLLLAALQQSRVSIGFADNGRRSWDFATKTLVVKAYSLIPLFLVCVCVCEN